MVCNYHLPGNLSCSGGPFSSSFTVLIEIVVIETLPNSFNEIVVHHEFWWRGTGGQETGRKGGRRCMGGGRRGGASGVPKVAGSGRKRENLCNIVQYFTIKKCKETGAKKYRAGTGIKGYRKREI